MKRWLCKLGLHAWKNIGYSSLVMPSPVDRCERCKCGRIVMWTGTLRLTPEELAALGGGGGRG